MLFPLAASPLGLAASQVRRPPQAGGAPKIIHIHRPFESKWY